MSGTAHGQGGPGRRYRPELQELFNAVRDAEEARNNSPPVTVAHSSDRQSNRGGRQGPLDEFTKLKARFVKRFGPCADCKARKVTCRLDHFPSEYERQYQLRDGRMLQQQAPNAAFVQAGSGSGPGSVRTGTSGHRPTGRQRPEPPRTTDFSTTSLALSSADPGAVFKPQPSSRPMATTNSSWSYNQSQKLTFIGSHLPGQHMEPRYPRDLGNEPTLPQGLPSTTTHPFTFGDASNSVPYAYGPQLVFGRRKHRLPQIWECLYGGDHPVLMSDYTLDTRLLACRMRFRSANDLWTHFHMVHGERIVETLPEEPQFLHFCTLCLMNFSFAHWRCECVVPRPEFWEERLYADIEKRGIIAGSSRPVLAHSTRVDMDWP